MFWHPWMTISAQNDNFTVVSFNNDSALTSRADDDKLSLDRYHQTFAYNSYLQEFLQSQFAFHEPWAVVLLCLYIPVGIVSLVTNVLVLYLILQKRSLRNGTNYYIAAICVSDLLGKTIKTQCLKFMSVSYTHAV